MSIQHLADFRADRARRAAQTARPRGGCADLARLRADDARRDQLEDARDRCLAEIHAVFAEIILRAGPAELAVIAGLFAADEKTSTARALMNLLAFCEPGPVPANQASLSYSPARAALIGRLAAEHESAALAAAKSRLRSVSFHAQ